MALTIGTNRFGAGILNQLNQTQSSIGSSVSRLSSGLQVGGPGNSGNAASIGIVQSLLSQAQGAMSAQDNVATGINLLETAQGGLSSITAILQRQRTLATAANTDTLTATDRGNLQAEFAQNEQEIDRIANNTTFNTKQLLNGANASVSLQSGANAGDQVTVPLPNATTNALGVNGLAIDTQAGAAAAITKLDAALSQVSASSGDLGAVENRLKSTAQTLSVSQMNLLTGESQIANTDFAAEVAGMTAAMMLQNTNVALLAQSNLSSRSVLRLFGQAA